MLGLASDKGILDFNADIHIVPPVEGELQLASNLRGRVLRFINSLANSFPQGLPLSEFFQFDTSKKYVTVVANRNTKSKFPWLN